MTNNLPEPDDAPWLNLSEKEVEELRYNKQNLTNYGREKIRELMLKSQMTEDKQLTEYIKEVLNLANDVEVSVYDEDNNTDDLSNGIVKVRVEKLK
jgi:DNA polymerase III delta prime subunit